MNEAVSSVSVSAVKMEIAIFDNADKQDGLSAQRPENIRLTTENVPDDKNTFKLFPKLAKELRLMVWKRALPGSRLVRYPSRPARLARPARHNYNLQEACRAENLTIPWIAQTCWEAHDVVQETFHKLPLAQWPCNKSPRPFVYINFDLDTLLLDWYTLGNESSKKLLSPLLGNLRKLALPLKADGLYKSHPFMEKLERPTFKALEKLTFHSILPLKMEDHHESWELLELDLNQPCSLQWPDDGPNELELYEPDELIDVVEEHGDLAILLAKAKSSAHFFNWFKEETPEWKDVSFSFSVLVVKKPGSSQRCLKYRIYERCEFGDPQEIFVDNENVSFKCHYHLEPIELEDFTLASCRPAVVDSWLTPNYVCEGCAKRRWIIYNDMFWVRGQDAGNSESSTTKIASDHQDDLGNISADEDEHSIEDNVVDGEN